MIIYLQLIISWGFYALFFIVPLIFTSKTSELFEYNKMMTVYAGTIIIVAAWIGKMILTKKLVYRRTFMEVPFLLYLGSHILSTIFSLDTRTSIFGYYSRFHEGLLASISYILLYFAAVSNLTARDVKNIFYSSFLSGIIIAIWGTFEHYGHSLSCVFVTGNFDVACWIQDVKNRVYATLGQPNWMAAYLDVLILMGFAFIYKRKNVMLNLFQHLTVVLFFASLLFTKSRSGVIGLLVGLAVYFAILFWKERLKILDPARMTILSLFFVFAIIFGLPLPKIEGKSVENYLSKPAAVSSQPITAPSGYIDIGISTSSDIRRVVWDGALKIWQRYPVFGSGVETFAYAYYKDRPAAHNMLSEWDFLYNKAHNEFLNILATTGTVGFLTYLLIIISFLIFNFKFLISIQISNFKFQIIGLFAAWISILVTNFFGFSVVIIGLFFFLIPAFCYLLSINQSTNPPISHGQLPMTNDKWVMLGGVLILVIYLEMKLWTMWRADVAYALGQNLDKINQPVTAFQQLQDAVTAVPEEPLYRDELSQNAATLALAAAQEQNATLSSQLANIALRSSDTVVADAPNNVVYWKSRARVYYSLSQLDPKTLPVALEAILKAVDLAPTDAKIHYFAGLLYDANHKKPEAIKMLEETAILKIDYRDARFQLAKDYLEIGDKIKARDQANFILTRLGDDEEVKKWLKENNL